MANVLNFLIYILLTSIRLLARLSTCKFLLLSSPEILLMQLFQRCSYLRSGKVLKFSILSIRLQLKLRHLNFQYYFNEEMDVILLLVSSILNMRLLSSSPVDYTIAFLYIDFQIIIRQIKNQLIPYCCKGKFIYLIISLIFFNNIMFRSSLTVLIVSCLLIWTQGFQIKLGLARAVLNIYNLNQNNEVKQSGLFMYRTLIFPYEVYEIKSRGSSIQQAKSFVFVRIPYQTLKQTLDAQPRTFQSVNQYEYLYHKIPQTVLFEGYPNEYMELIHEDPSLFNSHFIVQNSSDYSKNKAGGIFDLNFYSIQLTKYLEQSIHNAQKDFKSELKSETVTTLLQESNLTLEGINSNQTEKNQFILTNLLVNDSSTTYFGQLFINDMHRIVQHQATWFSYYDGFSIYFASASLKKIDNETIIDLWIVIVREGKEKRTQHIKEPIGYLHMSSIRYLKLCSSADKLKLLIADMSHIFVIDVTTHLWSFDLFKVGMSFNHLILDGSCKVLKINNQTITEIDGVTKVKFDQNIKSVATLKNIFVFCLESNICKIYSKDISKEIASGTLSRIVNILDCAQSIAVNESKITHKLVVRQKWGESLLEKQIDFKYGNQSGLKGNQSRLYQFIYPYEAYLNKTFLRSNELDKTFFYHLESLQNRQTYKIPQTFYEFSKRLLAHNCGEFDKGQASQRITIKDDSNWTICEITLTTSSLIHLKIDPNKTPSKIFICETSYQNYNINPQVNCQTYTHLEAERSFYLPNNKFVKLYILRAMRQHNLPTFYLRDIDKQQLLYASTIFFYLMLILSVSFFLVIIFIIIRPIIVAVMIYNGWRPDLTVPTYPLSWFQLKIKIKRLVQTKFLRYVPHQPTTQGQDNHCCFCLQNLIKGVTIAQLYCEHEFHKDCFNEWIKNEPNLRCPTCRRQFTRQQLNEFRSSHNLI